MAQPWAGCANDEDEKYKLKVYFSFGTWNQTFVPPGRHRTKAVRAAPRGVSALFQSRISPEKSYRQQENKTDPSVLHSRNSSKTSKDRYNKCVTMSALARNIKNRKKKKKKKRIPMPTGGEDPKVSVHPANMCPDFSISF
ncbi:hypothetical protein CDAR_6361 [Caerostris darwini]|uniref:Uncharacterized protein n=1 Tax=Caerostris darwini TaxID=1538125 RepID=A0AAV4S583_9ARAC|nr:hypothetical protein CDAR_6361 [Caerostris darwini]